jgi:hypothetical protein
MWTPIFLRLLPGTVIVIGLPATNAGSTVFGLVLAARQIGPDGAAVRHMLGRPWRMIVMHDRLPCGSLRGLPFFLLEQLTQALAGALLPGRRGRRRRVPS